jgi:hypothetical protein
VNKKDTPNSSNQQQKLELQAAERVVSWTGLAPNDYNFRSWATARNQPLIRAGCVYEYARESRKLRCLLVLINSALQKAKQSERERKQSQPFRVLSLSFEGLRYKDALLQLGGWFGWLRLFTDQLADNTSFAGLCEKNDKQVNDSLGRLPQFFLAPKAVEIALPDLNATPIEPRLLSPSQAPNAHHRNVENDVTVTIRIRLRDFTNREIGRAMEELASMLRPSTEKEPTRQGTGKRDSPRSWLDAVSAMRLASHYPKTFSLELIRRRRKTSARGTETALSIFEDVRLGSIRPGLTKRKIRGALSQNELDRYAARARRQFAHSFPFGEAAANGITWTERQRREIV